MRWLLALLAVSLAGAAYYAFYPPAVLERKTQGALEEIGNAVKPPRDKVGAALAAFLSDEAKLTLEVSVFHIGQDSPPPVVQNFDRAQFMAFIDNLLYTLTDYSLHTTLETFALHPDHQAADVVFTGDGWGDGPSYYGGVAVDARFSFQAPCTGKVTFENNRPRLQEASCKVQFRSVPKPGQEGKLSNPEALKDVLMQR